jgi:hypothetical protein
MLRRTFLAALGITVLLLAGCRSAPIYNVVAAPVTTLQPASMQTVEAAILKAGGALGWTMVQKEPGRIEGVLALRGHKAVIEVLYDTKSYSIKYKDSVDLDYDGKNIHKNYNGWIENLDRAIKSNLIGP